MTNKKDESVMRKYRFKMKLNNNLNLLPHFDKYTIASIMVMLVAIAFAVFNYSSMKNKYGEVLVFAPNNYAVQEARIISKDSIYNSNLAIDLSEVNSMKSVLHHGKLDISTVGLYLKIVKTESDILVGNDSTVIQNDFDSIQGLCKAIESMGEH